jgi:hypothetical protein
VSNDPVNQARRPRTRPSRDRPENSLAQEKQALGEASDKARGLIEALSYIQRFHNKTVVVKVGGSIMDDEQACRTSWPTSCS